MTGTATERSLRVLSLVTSPRPFYSEETEALRATGVDVDVVTVPGRDRGTGGRRITDYLRFYRRVLSRRRAEYDLVHANYGLTVPFALAQPHRPIVASLWGSDVLGSLDWVTKRSVGRCAERIVMSEQMREELSYDAHVVPHGVDFETFKPMDQSETRQAVGWDPTRRYVLFPYDPSRPVKAYPRAERIVTDVTHELGERVALEPVHGVDHERIPLYMNAADALLLTSRHEGFPNAVKEALACNLPVVTTNVGTLERRLDDVSNSFVCDSDDELVSRLTTVLARGRRSDGREHARDVSIGETTAKVHSVYRRALESDQ